MADNAWVVTIRLDVTNDNVWAWYLRMRDTAQHPQYQGAIEVSGPIAVKEKR